MKQDGAKRMSRHRPSAPRWAIISVALAVPLLCAHANDASQELARILQDNANRQAMIETAREQNGQLPDACESATYSETHGPQSTTDRRKREADRRLLAAKRHRHRLWNAQAAERPDIGATRRCAAPHCPIIWEHDRGSAPAAGCYPICVGSSSQIDTARLPSGQGL
jgi:hypothetical protein